MISNFFKEIHASQKAKCKITNMPTGYPDLDYYTRGLVPGNVYVFCGAPRTLKTALLLQISHFMGCDFSYWVRFFSLFSSVESLIKRMLFAVSDISILTFPYETPNYSTMQKLFMIGERLRNSQFKFVCNSLLTLENIENECKSKGDGKGVVVIDSFQLFAYNKQKSSVLRKLKEIAVKWNIVILVAYDTNHNSIVNEHFLIKNGVDSIFLLKLEKFFGLDEGSGTLFFSILKQKDGPSADFILNYNKNSFKIYDDENDIFDFSHSFANERIPVC